MSETAWGPAPASGVLRARPEDFRVFEELGHTPTGEGEHLWVEVEKRGANTVFVAAELARAAGVPARRVGFAGLKDRNAVTRQWFSIHLPGRPVPDWREWRIEGVRILAAARSARKIQRGRLAGNRFELVLRGIEGDLDALEERLRTLAAHGAPNGFGEQRFGGNNIARAHRLFRGELRRRPNKSKRGFYLSAARSLIFNLVLAERIRQGNWNRLIEGDIAMLDGSRSVFPADSADAEQVRRCAELDLHPTGPLAGVGENPTRQAARAIEEQVFERQAELVEGLEKFRLEHQRRALRVRLREPDWVVEGDRLRIAFGLPAGSYATAVLREAVRYTDLAAKHEELP